MIVVAGASSYECPFQMPASMAALQDPTDNKIAWKWLSNLSPLNVIPLLYTTSRNTPKLIMASVSLPSPASLPTAANSGDSTPG